MQKDAPLFLFDPKNLYYFFGAYLLFMAIPSDAFAGSNSIQDTICRVVWLFQGQAGKNIASLAVLIVGVGALMGKISAGLCLIVCVGIAIIFGAKGIVQAITLQNVNCNVTGTPSEIEKLVCNVVLILTGTTGKALATLCVIILGVGALMGKISWPLALTVTVGIALLFGAVKIVEAIAGPNTPQGCIAIMAVNLNQLQPVGVPPLPSGVPPVTIPVIPPPPGGR
jgi:type IV secretory pathway VirB2 component (pilin)